MINNRQGGRRRGRGGQRAPNSGGQQGNRQDNRQRGNAAQLLEKYKSMARDSQLAGDRVQTEYYLQYADHYFRLLSETRSRYEDQRPQRSDDLDDEDGDDGEFEADGGDFDSGQDRNDREDRQDRQERPERAERSPRTARPRRDEQNDRPAPRGTSSSDDRIERDVREDGDENRPARSNSTATSEELPSPRVRAPRAARSNGGETMPFDALPPAIGADSNSATKAGVDDPGVDAGEKPQPRRRTRAVRPTDDEAAPAG
ncbi:MAG: DUF4167 domain-containing protein [Sphingomicrobium sp.]